MKLKKLKTAFAFSVMALLSENVFAGNDCKVVDASVVSVMPWENGEVFINLDKNNNCGCTIPSRFGFLPTDRNFKVYLAEAITAFSTGKKVTILGNAGCTIHGNTSAVYTIILGGGQ